MLFVGTDTEASSDVPNEALTFFVLRPLSVNQIIVKLDADNVFFCLNAASDWYNKR